MPSWAVSLIIAAIGALPQILSLFGVVSPDHAAGLTGIVAPITAGAVAGAAHATK